ncbi:neuroglobin-1-like [Daphnia pulicaria]|uniref:neuroglobin-1-like n=1 Tax=Daphnia pulicaria TaxID=35523 RepID=UPI001EEB27AA|nr:neuroglobin-1-like [Daphnia pulicaria]XP_046653419.1 neuroglobin-1-like [Daphnia pulicaria]
MGNAHVTHGGNGKNKTANGKDEVRNGGDRIFAALPDSTAFPPAKKAMASVADLTDLQKTLLQESWKRLEKDIAQVGIIMFINLFETHPDMQSVFLPFTGVVLDDLKKSKLLSEHALRVMGAVQRAVHRLQEPEKLHAFLSELGRKHEKNGAKLEYIDYIGPQFLCAIRPILGDDWTLETEKAWTLLLDYMTATMKESLVEARNASAAESSKPLTLPPSSSSSLSAATDD